MKTLGFLLGFLCASFAWAEVVPQALDSDVILLGEVHDNPAHHAVQAEWVAAIAPRAIVFEMITQEQADSVTPELRSNSAALEAALDWKTGGWPDFAMYYPIFDAAPDAQILGAAVPREAARAAMQAGVAETFGPDAEAFGLTTALPEAEMQARLALQASAHCDALPEHLLPAMVDVQRLRDATMARAVVRALAEYGPPVAVITGNGHARRDWGVPALLARAAPETGVFVLLQGEDGQEPDGGGDLVLHASAVDRPDPCAAFR